MPTPRWRRGSGSEALCPRPGSSATNFTRHTSCTRPTLPREPLNLAGPPQHPRILNAPDLDPIFLADSYGYRPRKSALDAVGVTRERCWKYDWVLEFDIKGLFDNLPHELLLKAVQKHVKCKWAL